MADWGKILAGALASGIGEWGEAQVDVAKKEREAIRQEGLKEAEMAWEKEKLSIQLDANKQLKQQEIDANKEVTDAAAKRAEAKEAKDDEWEKEKFASQQAYQDKSLAVQEASANRDSAGVQELKWKQANGIPLGTEKQSPAVAVWGKLAQNATANGTDLSELPSVYDLEGAMYGKKKDETTVGGGGYKTPGDIIKAVKNKASSSATTEDDDSTFTGSPTNKFKGGLLYGH